MYAKIQITGTLEVRTGMHIGGSSAFAAIGAVDSPVVKDVRTGDPMVPGSSLKGKMRTLLAKEYNQKEEGAKAAKTPDEADAPCLLRLFGCAKGTPVRRSRVLISDMFLSNKEELKRQGLQGMTEVKFENTINRVTAVANPRQIERVVRGSQFALDIMYELENESEAAEDIAILAEGLRLMQYDYLGGNGSRGYGKVRFHDLCAEAVVGSVSKELLAQCNEALQKAVGLSEG